MKSRITRSLIVFALLCVTVITLMSFCACQKGGDDTQPSGYQPRNDIPKYDSLSAGIARIYFNVYENLEHEIEIINSLSDLEKFNFLGTSYTEDYFENHVIFLIPFCYASSDKNIEFIDIAIKEGKFYPIFATNSPIANELITDDVMYNLYIIGVEKRVLEYEFEYILVINRRDVNFGSVKYKSITLVFE